MTRVLLGLSVVIACALGVVPWAHATEGAESIVFYDPDANYEAIPRIVQSLNAYFAQELPGYSVKVTANATGVHEAIKGLHASYAILSSDYLAGAKEEAVAPLLIPESQGSVYYQKILVDRGKGTVGDLRGKRVAAATGDRRAGASQKIFSLLRVAGLLVDGAVFLGTTKDLDALLALTFGQADAAFVTSFSVDTLRAVNPGAAASLRDLWKSGNILRPVLVAVKSNEVLSQRSALIKSFTNLPNTPAGRSAMQALAYDRWVPYSADLAGGGAHP